MLTVKIIAVGALKEQYLRDACSEYKKRMSAYCRPEITEIKESRLPDRPSDGEIAAALAAEGKSILSAVPARAYTVALCVEGTQQSSAALAEKLSGLTLETDTVCFIIGSSHGLSDEVKRACRERLSFSQMTFPHQLMRVMLLEQVYRALSISAGGKYNK